MKRILILTMIAVFLAAPMVMAQAGHGCGPKGGHPSMKKGGFGHPGGERGGFYLLECKKELELTDEQTEKIKTIKFEHQNKMIDIKADLKKAILAKRNTMQTDNPDKNEVLLVTKQISDIKAKIAEMRVNHRFDLRAILTADQLEKLEKCRQECRSTCGPKGHEMKKIKGRGQGHGTGHRDGSCLGG